MNIAFMSDLHFEFHSDHGHSFVRSLDTTGVDLLILAGDIAVGKQTGQALKLFCDHFKTAQIVYVRGNHEHYRCGRGQLNHVLARAERKCDRLHVMTSDRLLTLPDGRRLLGDTMWFRNNPASVGTRSEMNDFVLIPRFTEWVFDQNARFLRYLEEELREGDIVVTHHLPTKASIPSQFRFSLLNPFFLCDVEPLILERKPALWVHGHTHDSVDTVVGATRIVCNPFGYVGHELNPAFDSNRRIVL